MKNKIHNWQEEIDKWDSLLLDKYQGESCVMCGLSADGLKSFFNSIITGILDEVGQDIIGPDEPKISDELGYGDEEWFRNGLRLEQRAKLLKLREKLRL